MDHETHCIETTKKFDFHPDGGYSHGQDLIRWSVHMTSVPEFYLLLASTTHHLGILPLKTWTKILLTSHRSLEKAGSEMKWQSWANSDSSLLSMLGEGVLNLHWNSLLWETFTINWHCLKFLCLQQFVWQQQKTDGWVSYIMIQVLSTQCYQFPLLCKGSNPMCLFAEKLNYFL